MKFSVFGKTIDIGDRSEIATLKQDYTMLQQSFDALLSTSTMKQQNETWNPMVERPNMDVPMVSTDSGAKIGVYPFPLHFLYQMVKNIDALRIPIDVLNREIHRNGFTVEPRYRFKCRNCKKEFKTKPLASAKFVEEQADEKSKDDKLKCDVCKKDKFKEPNPANRQKLINLIERKINNNNQTLKQMSKQLERDLDIADMAIVLLLKRYKKESDGTFRKSILEEIIRVSPAQVYIIADNDGRLGMDDNGNEVFFCPQHRRSGRVYRETNHMGQEIDPDKIPKCKICGFECLKAYLEVNSSYQTTVANPKVVLYGLNEAIICAGKYWTDLIYGYSPIYTLWSKAMALSHMDEYVRKYFDKMRPPKGLLVIGSRNNQSLQKAFDNMKSKMKEDPFALNPLMVETERGGRNMVQYVDLTGSLQDLQFIDVRDEFRRSIGAMYGVLPLFSGDLPTGWNQEGMEAMVTNRAVQTGQETLFDGIYEPLAKMMGVHDWIIKLNIGEEVDEMRTEQLEGQRIANAQGMKSMGFRVEKDAESKFVFSQKPVEEVTQDRMPQKQPSPKTEQSTMFGGEPLPQRPSDEGGVAEGHPASGERSSLSRKAKSKKPKTKGYY